MEKQVFWTKVTLWVGRFVGLLLAALVFLLPSILGWYAGFRFLSVGQQRCILVAFYCCVVIIGWALAQLDWLLRNILKGEVFVRKNVKALRRVQWSCGLIGGITAVTGVAYLPLMMLAVMMVFLCLTITVVSHVLDAAVTIREENDLTI